MITNIKSLNGEIEYKEELEQFFVMLQKFNNNQKMDLDRQTRISEFMVEKWSCDKNNFLVTDHD